MRGSSGRRLSMSIVGVHPAKLVKHHVAQGISELDFLRVGVVDRQQGGETVPDQLTGTAVRPQPVLPVRVMPGPGSAQ